MCIRDSDSYVEVISDNIIGQMKEQMAADEGNVYWLKGDVEDFVEPFEQISREQSFYINADGKLVISFDKYEVCLLYTSRMPWLLTYS